MNNKSVLNSSLISYYFSTLQHLKSNQDLNKLYNCFINSRNFIRKNLESENLIHSSILTTTSDKNEFICIKKEIANSNNCGGKIQDFEIKLTNDEFGYKNDSFFELNKKNKFSKKHNVYNKYYANSNNGNDENEINNNETFIPNDEDEYINNESRVSNINVNSNYIYKPESYNVYNNNNTTYFYINAKYSDGSCQEVDKTKSNNYSTDGKNSNEQTYFIKNNQNRNINNFTDSEKNNFSISDINQPPFTPFKYIKKNDSLALNFLKQNHKDKDNDSSAEKTNSSSSNSNKEEEENNQDYLVEMFGRKGWICKLCYNFNYETRVRCNRCKVDKKPENILGYKPKKKNYYYYNNFNNFDNYNNNNHNYNEIVINNFNSTRDPKFKDSLQNNNNKKNDWFCANCRNLNYAFRKVCNKCKAPKVYVLMNNLVINSINWENFSPNDNENFNFKLNFSNNNNETFYKPLFESNVGVKNKTN